MKSHLARNFKRLLGIAWLSCASALAGAATWSVSVNDQTGLPVVSKGGAPALTAAFVFWGGNWAWAGIDVQFKVEAPYRYALAGKSTRLDLDLHGRIQRVSKRQMTWDFDYQAASARQDVIGGGISFKFDLATFGAEMGDPELLPGNAGWAWGRPGADRIEMRFNPALATVYFERGMKQEIRAFVYKDSIPAGHTATTATLTLAGDMAFGPTTQERFGLADPAAWPADRLDWKTSPVDLSFLNRDEIPAGKHGFLKAAGPRLAFEDGTPARFWGTNLTAAALFGTSKEGVRQQARRLSALGFNLVRIHHHDSPWVDPNIFGDAKAADTRTLAPAQLDRLDWWIKCLKDEGIYVWLDLHVQRAFKPGDGIDNFAEIAKGKSTADGKGYNYVNPSLQRAMLDFARAYLGHRNAYTGLAYKDDAAVAAILLSNENDVTNHFGNALLPGKGAPAHSALYMDQSRQFAAAWGLPPDRTWHAWEPGPGKLFLNDLEHRFAARMISSLRDFGVRVPIATTSTWGANPMSALPALTTGDLVDVHSYGGTGELEKNPLYTANLVDWMALAQVAGKPLTVTEWNVSPFPVPDRHAIPLYVAGAASLQGWDAMMQYAYSQVPLDSAGPPSNWHAYNDPALIATLPAAALLYRQGHVRESALTYAFAPSKEQLFDQLISANTAPGLRSAAELARLVVVMPAAEQLPWLEKGRLPPGAKLLANPGEPLLAPEAGEIVASTGQLRRNWQTGVFTIATPRTQAATGWIGGRSIKLGDVTLDIGTGNASVAVQSLDGKPIRRSHSIMVSLAAQSVPAGPRQLPFHSEPVEGRIGVRAAKGLRLFAADPATGESRRLPVAYRQGRYAIQADASLGTHWLFLR